MRLNSDLLSQGSADLSGFQLMQIKAVHLPATLPGAPAPLAPDGRDGTGSGIIWMDEAAATLAEIAAARGAGFSPVAGLSYTPAQQTQNAFYYASGLELAAHTDDTTSTPGAWLRRIQLPGDADSYRLGYSEKRLHAASQQPGQVLSASAGVAGRASRC